MISSNSSRILELLSNLFIKIFLIDANFNILSRICGSSSRLFIGNLSFGYALAEALKVPRLLESGPNFPLVYPNGNNAFDFYFQSHFEELVEKLTFSK